MRSADTSSVSARTRVRAEMPAAPAASKPIGTDNSQSSPLYPAKPSIRAQAFQKIVERFGEASLRVGLDALGGAKLESERAERWVSIARTPLDVAVAV